MNYQIGQKYERISPIGAGQTQVLIFNFFRIEQISSKNISISGTLASGVHSSRKIQTKDFEKFLEKYKIFI